MIQKYYLEFEKPFKSLDEEILELESNHNPDQKLLTKQYNKRSELIKKIYSRLSRWERVQLARHPNRPYSKDYIEFFSPDFIELHGDRYFRDDPAVVSGIGHFDDFKVAWIGQQKGRNTKENLYRNFGMMRPEGYRKCIRLMKLADRFQIPVVSFIDTPGAYPGLGAEQRGQASAIANSIECCMSLTVPNISIIIGEGGSGGAIALASSNKVIMLENSIYSVISPEGCASILWRDPSKSLQAAEAMKLTAKDLLNLKVIDEIIPEPLGGAHRDPENIAADIKHSIIKNLKSFESFSKEEIYDHRKAKFLQIGRDQGFSKSTNIEGGGLSYKESNIQKLVLHLEKNKLIYAGIGLLAITSLITLIF